MGNAVANVNVKKYINCKSVETSMLDNFVMRDDSISSQDVGALDVTIVNNAVSFLRSFHAKHRITVSQLTQDYIARTRITRARHCANLVSWNVNNEDENIGKCNNA